jgi:anti-anti-sigma factor
VQRIPVNDVRSWAFRIDVHPRRRGVVVAPHGELDLATVPELVRTVDELRESGVDAVQLDLRGVTFLDSSGLRFVLRLSAARVQGLELSVVPGPPAVHRLFALTGADHLVPFAEAGDRA